MKNLRSALLFRPVELSDRTVLQHCFEILQTKNILPEICDYTFAILYLWRHLYRAEWCVLDDFLVIRICLEHEKWTYLEPLYIGDGDVSVTGVLQQLRKDALSRGEPFRMAFVSSRMATELNQDPDLYVYVNRDYANYVYRSESLSLLSGKKLQPKRNHVHQFLSSFPKYRVKKLSKCDMLEVLRLYERWETGRIYDNTMLRAERDVIVDAIDHFEELALEGLILSVPDENENYRTVAFSFGSAITPNMFCTHIEKADPSCRNAYAMVNKLTADSLRGRYEFINREEDLGEDRLRRAKLSYHPERLSETWFVMERASEEYKVWKLWQEAFNDSDEFLASYIYPYSSSNSRILMYEDDNPEKELLGMCHLHFFDSSLGLSAYLYALAVSEKARGRGLGTELVRLVVERAKNSGAKLLFAIQANLNFNAWENRLGFFVHPVKPCDLRFGNDYFQNAFGVEPVENASERVLVKCFDDATECAVRGIDEAIELKFIR